MNRLFLFLLLLACTVALTASADAQITVSSHTSIETINGQEHVMTTCQTLMQDPAGPANYPGGVAVTCTLNSNGALQTLPQCIGQPNAICSVDLGSVIDGGNYQTTATHGLIMDPSLTPCLDANGVAVTCYLDPLGYGVINFPALPPNRVFGASEQILRGAPALWIPGLHPKNETRQ